MAYRDILVQIDDTAASRTRAVTAAGLAARWKAQLTGVFLKNVFLHNHLAAEGVAYLPPQAIDALLREHAAAVLAASEAARATFEQAAAQARVVSDWRIIDGDADTALVACARRLDLTVFPPVARPSLGDHRIAAANLGLASGGPVLIVPDTVSGEAVGKRVLIGWNGSRESARALRDAQPFLSDAQSVHIVVVSPDGDGGPDGLLQRHLEHYGRKVELILDRSDDVAAADVLRRHVAALDADLLVLGLYGRSRLQEWVLGGVSRDLLHAPPTTLLVSH